MTSEAIQDVLGGGVGHAETAPIPEFLSDDDMLHVIDGVHAVQARAERLAAEERQQAEEKLAVALAKNAGKVVYAETWPPTEEEGRLGREDLPLGPYVIETVITDRDDQDRYVVVKPFDSEDSSRPVLIKNFRLRQRGAQTLANKEEA